MSDNLPPLPDLNRLSPFVEGLGKAILREMMEDLAAIEADRVSRDVPACRVADRGFRWNGDRQEHVPQLVIEFDAVPFDGPEDAKGWTDRDRFADMLAASPQPQPVQASEAEKFMDAAGLCRRCAAPVADAPIDMVLHCPACGMQHVDAPSPTDGQNLRMWSNPPHRSHLCRPEDGGCGHIWRPADVPTNGVGAIKTTGKVDSPVSATPQPVQVQPSEAATLAIEALEAAKNGLEWYRTEYPEQVNGCDDEMDQQIEAAIAALQGKPAEQAQKKE